LEIAPVAPEIFIDGPITYLAATGLFSDGAFRQLPNVVWSSSDSSVVSVGVLDGELSTRKEVKAAVKKISARMSVLLTMTFMVDASMGEGLCEEREGALRYVDGRIRGETTRG